MDTGLRATGVCLALLCLGAAPVVAAAAAVSRDQLILVQKDPQQRLGAEVLEYEARPQNNILESPEKRTLRVAPKGQAESKASSDRVARPDWSQEQRLWTLLEKGEYNRLRREIRILRSVYPQWQPPAKLTQLLADGLSQEQITRAIGKNDAASIVRLSRQYPWKFSCRNIHFIWALAESLMKTGRPDAAVRRYDAALRKCDDLRNGLATAYKAERNLPPEYFELLLDKADSWYPTVRDSPEMADLRYGFYVKRYVELSKQQSPRADTYLETLSDVATERQDFELAKLIGWELYDAAAFTEARAWFARATHWQKDEESTYGLALSYFSLDQLENTERAIREFEPQSDRLRVLLGQVLERQAVVQYERGHFSESLRRLDEANAVEPLSRSGRLLQAWALFAEDRYAEAATQFEDLYRMQPDEDSAPGVFYSNLALDNETTIVGIAETSGGPLQALWTDYRASQLYERKRFLAARHVSSAAYAELTELDTPQARLGFTERWRSGDSGLDKLTASRRPIVEGVYVYNDVHRVALRLDNVNLDSGSMRPNEVVGSYPLAPQPYKFNPDTDINAGIEPRLSYLFDGWNSYYAELGATPLDAPINSEVAWRLGTRRNVKGGWWQVEAASQPVRDSMLSYVGMRDPYEGKKWGRVLETGFSVAGYMKLEKGWGVYGKSEYGKLDGDDVKRNDVIRLSLAIGKDLGLNDFDYFSVGPYLGYVTYDKNLNHFTVGNGGYFSPQDMYTFGLGASAVTPEGKQYIVSGELQLGYQIQEEDRSPFFPLNPDGHFYDDNDEAGFGGKVFLRGVRRLDDHWQIGGSIEAQVSPEYDNYAAMLFLRWNFKGRPAVVSSDIDFTE